MKKLTVAIVVVTISLLPVMAVASPQDDANDVAQEVMSPFCPGVTLHECPSARAIELRDEIADWFAAGLSRAQVFERLEDEYGPSIRATPDPKGAGLAAWLVPALAVLLGLGIVGFVLRRRSEAESEVSVAGPDRERLESELSVARARR